MVAPIVAAEAAKRAERAGKGLTGDLFVQRWITQKGTGKKAITIERELHINPVVIGVGAAATAVGALTALWLAQMRVSPTKISVPYGRWVWSDGTAASKELLSSERGAAPSRTVTPYTPEPSFFVPFTVETTVEYATWVELGSKEITRFGVKERRGFTILGGATEFPAVAEDVWLAGSPVGYLLDKLKVI